MKKKIMDVLKKTKGNAVDSGLDAFMNHNRPDKKHTFLEFLKEWGWLIKLIIDIIISLLLKLAKWFMDHFPR